jgi:hypothetical protein
MPPQLLDHPMAVKIALICVVQDMQPNKPRKELLVRVSGRHCRGKVTAHPFSRQ